MSTWLPTGTLSDETLLFGPLNQKMKEDEPNVQIVVNGKPYWVYHSGKEINPELMDELLDWAGKRVATYTE